MVGALPTISSLSGVFDHAAGAALQERIKAHVRRNHRHHVIDLRSLTSVDARTMRVMAKINRNTRAAGGTVHLVIENPKAIRYVRLTSLERELRVYPTPTMALAAARLPGASREGTQA